MECIVVRDTVTLDGDGNVWYFGELSFEVEDDEIVSLEGSREAGEDSAHPGIVMKAAPVVGDIYRQEYLLGEAEDIGVVWGENRTVTVPYGTFTGCLKTGDFTPIEPGALEYKFYAPDVGFVMEVKPATGEKLELVEITTGN